MEIRDDDIRHAAEQTEVLRFPRQTLATFGTTQVYYYLLTRPIYGSRGDRAETVVREGMVSAERPRIVTPSYITKLEGFGENARRYLDAVIRDYGPHVPGLLYSYKNEPGDLNIVSDDLEVVTQRLNEKIDSEGHRLGAIIKGVDELWDVSLLKFIRELIEGSVRGNLAEMRSRGLLDVDTAGIPRDARYRIDSLFREVARGDRDPSELKKELDGWGLFSEYEDRFLSLFRKRP